MHTYPQVSIVVLCYRNFRYVYDAITSVLAQNYPNIELIISDDGSDHFPKEDILQFVEANKGENITNIIINQNDKNVGTVRHLNIVARLSHGTYFMSLSADDMLNSEAVLSTYVDALSANEDYDILMAQTAMYDESMSKILYYFVQPHIRDILLHDQDSDALFIELSKHAYLPSVSTFFRHTFFEKYGYFDEAYDLVEDWSLHLRLAREHIPILYHDFVSVRHRSGGVSHGNTAGISATYHRYLNDLNRTFQNDIEPYSAKIPKTQWDNILHRHKADLAWIDLQTRYKPRGTIGIICYFARHPGAAFAKVLPSVYYATCGKQMWLLLISLLLFAFEPWLSLLFGTCVGVTFSVNIAEAIWVFACIFQVCIALTAICGVVFAIFYFAAYCYTLIDRYMQCYF